VSEIYPVTRERHGARAWKKSAGLGWARHERAVVVSRQEAMQLMMTLPLAFIRHAEQYHLVVVLGLRQDENVVVGPNGNWLGGQVPALLQNYPFRLLRSAEGLELLGVDESGLLPPGTEGGMALFNGEAPAPELTAILEQLMQGDKQRQHTRQVVAVLDQHGLLEPWDIQIQSEAGIRKVEGLYRVNEKKFNEVPAESLLELRNRGALVLAYSQLMSMHHIHQLRRLSEARQRAEAAMVGDHGVISFANL
jgi:hypothetical protein